MKTSHVRFFCCLFSAPQRRKIIPLAIATSDAHDSQLPPNCTAAVRETFAKLTFSVGGWFGSSAEMTQCSGFTGRIRRHAICAYPAADGRQGSAAWLLDL